MPGPLRVRRPDCGGGRAGVGGGGDDGTLLRGTLGKECRAEDETFRSEAARGMMLPGTLEAEDSADEARAL